MWGGRPHPLAPRFPPLAPSGCGVVDSLRGVTLPRLACGAAAGATPAPLPARGLCAPPWPWRLPARVGSVGTCCPRGRRAGGALCALTRRTATLSRTGGGEGGRGRERGPSYAFPPSKPSSRRPDRPIETLLFRAPARATRVGCFRCRSQVFGAVPASILTCLVLES